MVRAMRWAKGGVPRRLALAVGCLLLALALITGALRAGSRYFYCDAMGVMLDDPCRTARAHDDAACGDPGDELRDHAIDCCQVGTLRAMPDGARAERSAVPPASLRAVLPTFLFVGESRFCSSSVFLRAAERWLTPPRPPGERRAQLMVFLT